MNRLGSLYPRVNLLAGKAREWVSTILGGLRPRVNLRSALGVLLVLLPWVGAWASYQQNDSITVDVACARRVVGVDVAHVVAWDDTLSSEVNCRQSSEGGHNMAQSSFYYGKADNDKCGDSICHGVLIDHQSSEASNAQRGEVTHDVVSSALYDSKSDSSPCENKLHDAGLANKCDSETTYCQRTDTTCSVAPADTVCSEAVVLLEASQSDEPDSVGTFSWNEDLLVTGGDSLEMAKWRRMKRLLANTRPYRMVCVGLPLVAEGLLAMKEDKNFRQLRTDYFPRYKHTADDYLQYSPAVVMVGLKAAGVKSRSSWGRMLTSDVFSVGIMAVVANGLKETLHVRRPDGSNTRSFPSGHTATAFMTATMLTKEYGYKSKWVGFGAYTVASGVGLMRMANNRHWLSDVMVGAGIGVISTELGYFLSDLIFKDKGLNRPKMEREEYHRWTKPSFLGLRLGGFIPLHRYTLGTDYKMDAAAGCAAGGEGAYFFNHWIGVGGQALAGNYRVLLENQPSRTVHPISVMAGPYFSWPLTTRCSLGSKVTAGYVHMDSMNLPDKSVAARNGADFSTGLNCTYKVRQNYLMGLYLDYFLLPPQSNYDQRMQHMLMAGTSFNIIF